MKKIILIILIVLEISINEFSLKFLSSDNSIGLDFTNKIRFFNLIVFVSLLIFYFYYENLVKLQIVSKLFFLFSFIILVDYLSGFVEFGYKKIEKDSYRYIYPYDWIRGEPNKLDHNQYGFRGNAPDTERENGEIIIGFFGGSTGYAGEPTIIEIVSNQLNNENLKNNIVNFSSVSSNHNQHLHRLLEFSEYTFDVIIFYGGGNETIQHFYYDSRPGYPYNFYLYDSNSNSLINFFIKYSNLIGEIDKLFNLYLDFNPKTSNETEFISWAKKTKKNYFDTIQKSKRLTENFIVPNQCERSFFIPIFQPMVPPNDRTKKLVEIVRSELEDNGIHDLSYLKSQLNFTDFIHVDQESKEVIARKIALLIKNSLNNKEIC
jgi:hypothetical protein